MCYRDVGTEAPPRSLFKLGQWVVSLAYIVFIKVYTLLATILERRRVAITWFNCKKYVIKLGAVFPLATSYREC